MKKYMLFVLLLAFFASCSGNVSNGTLSSKGPIIEYDTGLDVAADENNDRIDSIESGIKPYINISNEFVIVQIIQTNLDVDGEEEQIIAYKKKNDAASPIEILVVDYDSLREVYRKAWSATLTAVNPFFFSVTPMDVTGNHSDELVVEGIDAEGKQVFTIYQREISAWGISLVYAPVFSIKTRGRIEIVHKNRSQAYSRGQTEGEAFDIILTEETSDDSGKRLLITKTYKWNPIEKTFIETATETKEKEITSDSLKELFEGSVEDIENFLAGPWFKESGSKRLFVDFDINNREITFFSTDIQEQYLWKSSVKNIYSGLGINARSAILANLSQYFYIVIEDNNTIRISASKLQTNDTFSWAGTYYRLTPGLQKSLLKQDTIPLLKTKHLSGRFYNETSGGEIIFYPPNRIKITSSDTNIEGYYTLYQIKDTNILQIKIKNSQEKLYYSIDYHETETNIGIKKEITLTPVKLKSTDISPIPGQLSTTLQQLENKTK